MTWNIVLGKTAQLMLPGENVRHHGVIHAPWRQRRERGMKKSFHVGLGARNFRDLKSVVSVERGWQKPAWTDSMNESGQLFGASFHQCEGAAASQVESWVVVSPQPTTRLMIVAKTGSKGVQGIHSPLLKTHLEIYYHGSFPLPSIV